MTNEARTEAVDGYNVPGQRRGYTSCTASSSDEGSGLGLTSPDLEEEVAVIGEDLTLVDDSDVEEHEAMDTIKRAVKSSTAAPSRPPRVIDTRPSSSSATSWGGDGFAAGGESPSGPCRGRNSLRCSWASLRQNSGG